MGILNFLQKLKMKRCHAELLDYIKKPDFTSYDALGGVVLTELEAIRRTHVEAWSRLKEVRQRYQIEEKDIRALYQQAEVVSADGLISMEPLAEQLRVLISKSQRQRY